MLSGAGKTKLSSRSHPKLGTAPKPKVQDKFLNKSFYALQT